MIKFDKNTHTLSHSSRSQQFKLQLFLKMLRVPPGFRKHDRSRLAFWSGEPMKTQNQNQITRSCFQFWNHEVPPNRVSKFLLTIPLLHFHWFPGKNCSTVLKPCLAGFLSIVSSSTVAYQDIFWDNDLLFSIQETVTYYNSQLYGFDQLIITIVLRRYVVNYYSLSNVTYIRIILLQNLCICF